MLVCHKTVEPSRVWKCSTPTTVLAYAALLYTMACVGYLLLTRSYGTPFDDTLTGAQREVKRASAQTRAKAFGSSLIVSAIVLALWRPLARDRTA